MANSNNATQPEPFDRLRAQLLNATPDWAANKATNRFASGQVSNLTPAIPTLYGYVQCVHDMSGFECGRCLRALFEPIPDFLGVKQGGRVIGVVCTMRYELHPFLAAASILKLMAQPTDKEPAAAPAPGGKGSKNVTGTALAIAIPAAAAIALITFVCICFCRHRRRPQIPHYEDEREKITSVESILFDASTL